MPERVLVTGATGFVAGHLVEFLLNHTDAEVYAAKRRRSDTSLPEHTDRVHWVEMDVTDAHNVFSTVRSVRPTHLFHLAAQSFVPTSWISPAETLSINAIGTVNLLEAVKSLDLDTRIQVAGSSEEYGDVRPSELPTPVMRVGNLDATRDFTDVRDIVRAYWLALKAGEPGEDNICTGSALSIRQLLDTLLGLSTVQGIQIKSDPQRMRPSDVLNLLGDCSKFRQATGWKPERTLDTTLRDLLTNWRDRLRKDPPGDRRPVHAHRS